MTATTIPRPDAIPIIKAHIANHKSQLAALSEQARAELTVEAFEAQS